MSERAGAATKTSGPTREISPDEYRFVLYDTNANPWPIFTILATGASPPSGMTVGSPGVAAAAYTEYWFVNTANIQYLSVAASLGFTTTALQGINYTSPYSSTQQFSLPQNVTWTSPISSTSSATFFLGSDTTSTNVYLQLVPNSNGSGNLTNVYWFRASVPFGLITPSGSFTATSSAPPSSYCGVNQVV